MTDPDTRFDELIATLKERNFRLTPPRVDLVRFVAVSEGHPSANQFYEKIKLKLPAMSHATVYKTLALLKELNQMLEIDTRQDSHYDGNRPPPHPHLICMTCNKIVDGDLSLDQETIRKLEEISGYSIMRPQVSFYGICPDRREEN